MGAARLEHILRNAVLTLLDQPRATLADLSRLFTDDAYRADAVSRVTHVVTREFWAKEFEGYQRRSHAAALAPLFNKLGAFLSQPPIYRVLTREHSGYDIRDVLDGGRVLLVNLAKGKIGTDGASLLGALILTRLSVAGLSRADTPVTRRRPFFVYADEFHNFTTLTTATMLAELRKYGVGLILAHQYVGQLSRELRDAILGNAGTVISFRIGAADTPLLSRVFAPDISGLDLRYLPNHAVFIRMMVHGQVVSPFSASTQPPSL